MLQLICHLIGDYCLQTHWMAAYKVKDLRIAALHATFYMVPFWLCFTIPTWPFLAMWGSHTLIDRYGLGRRYCSFMGVGVHGPWTHFGLGGSPAPDYLRTWLTIIVDNTMHLTINYLCLAGLP